MRLAPTLLAVLLIAMAHGQDALADSAKDELVAASDAKAPKSISELSKTSSDALKVFTTAKVGDGFTAEQKAYVAGLYLLTTQKAIDDLNAAAPKNFRLPKGRVTLAGEVLLPFDLTTDANNYAWCRDALLAMKVLKRAAADFPVSVETPIGDGQPVKGRPK